ncbi:Histone demethylase UTY, partial [Plecturocebus cupreus]
MGFHCVGKAGLKLLTSSDPPPWPQKCCDYRQTEFCHVDQAGLELLTSGDPPALTSQCIGITSVSHRAWPIYLFIFETGFQLVTQAVVQCCDLSSLQPQPLGHKDHAALHLSGRLCQRFNLSSLIEMGFHCVGQTGLELPALASQSVGITGMSHHTCPTWSAEVRSQLTATSASQVQVILVPQTPKWLDYRRRRSLTMLPRLVLNSRAQAVCPPRLPKCWDYRHEPLCPAKKD